MNNTLGTQMQLIATDELNRAKARAQARARQNAKGVAVTPGGAVLAQSFRRIEGGTRRGKSVVPVRSAMTDKFNMHEHDWLVARAGLTDWIKNPALGETMNSRYVSESLGSHMAPNYGAVGHGLGDLGDLGAVTEGQWLWQNANSAVRRVMPPGAKAAIDASPLTSKQKSLLKTEPLTVFVVAAEFSKAKFVEFINRTNKNRPSSYTIGGSRIRIRPNVNQSATSLAAQFLAVANQNPVSAHLVAVQMAYELGIEAPVAMVKAGVGKEIETRFKAGQQAVSQGVKNVEKALGIDIPFFGMGALTVAAAGSTATTGTQAAAASVFGTGLTGAQFVGLVEAAIGLAGLLVPALLALATGKAPPPPSKAQQNAAQSDAGKVNAAKKQTPPAQQAQLNQAATASDRIFGLPKVAVYGGAVLLAVGGIVTALRKK